MIITEFTSVIESVYFKPDPLKKRRWGSQKLQPLKKAINLGKKGWTYSSFFESIRDIFFLWAFNSYNIYCLEALK
jgi:hypothetical protein